MTQKMIAGMLFLIAVGVSTSWAEPAETDFFEDPATWTDEVFTLSHTNDPFDQGSWFGTVSFGLLGDGEIYGGQVAAGVGFFFLDDFSITAEGVLSGHELGSDGEDSLGIGINLLARWHFYQHEQWSIFLEGGLGVLYTTRDYPVASSDRWNFSQNIGLGCTYQIDPDLILISAVKYQHTSNAGLGVSNPGFDGIIGYVGIMHPF